MKQANIILTLAAFVMTSPVLFSQESVSGKFAVLSGSRLWLDGSATIGGFSCGTGVVTGQGVLDGHHTTNKSAEVSIVVKNLDCGNSRMNDDMFEAMKAEQHDKIQFELLNATLTRDSLLADGWFHVRVVGSLTIAGVTRETEIPVSIRELPGKRYQLKGSKELSMLDFGITPPTAFWGIVRADDRLTVNFSLTAGISADLSKSNLSDSSGKR